MYGCESWTMRKAECQRIDAFELQCWRRFLRVSWTAIKQVNTRGNQAWIFTGRTDAEAETPILWPPAAKNWLTGILMLGKIEGGRRREWQRMRWLDGITGSKDMNLSKLGNSEGQGSLVCFISQDHRVRHDLVSEQQNSLLVKERISKVMKTM